MPPADERHAVMHDVACTRCGAVVQAVKFSPQHTSVQWTAQATAACAEFASHRGAGGSRVPARACLTLRSAIDRAVAGGSLPEGGTR